MDSNSNVGGHFRVGLIRPAYKKIRSLEL